jgi:hypothetical protein
MEYRANLDGTVARWHLLYGIPAPNLTLLRRVVVQIHNEKANLNDVKRHMAVRARKLGANAIVDFQYGQRSFRGLELLALFMRNTEVWYGEGDAVAL